MPRTHSVKALYRKHLGKAINPIVNDDDVNPHKTNTSEFLLRQEGKHRKSIRDSQSEPKGAGTFEPSGPNTHYRPNSDSHVPYDR